MIPSVNFHLWQPCNMRCKFCYATFQDVKRSVLPKGHLPKERSIDLVHHLAEHGFEKITFAGGEPTLCPWLGDLIRTAKEAGMTTMVVTNGTRLDEDFLTANRDHLDWIALSIDSVHDATNLAIGRALTGRTPISEQGYFELVDRVKARGYRLKLNTVVNRHNRKEDLSSFVRHARPERWKLLQALPIIGQNDLHIDALTVTHGEFEDYVHRHAHLEGLTRIVPETNAEVRGSYVMVDPVGRFFDNAEGAHRYSRPILEVGTRIAIQQMRYDEGKFTARGGRWSWADRSNEQQTAVAVSETIQAKGFVHLEGFTPERFKVVVGTLGGSIHQTEVRIRPDAKGMVTSPRALDLHTDHHAARYIAWYCHRQSSEGGESLLLDATAAFARISPAHRDRLFNLYLSEHRVFADDPGSWPLVMYHKGRLRFYYSFWLVSESDRSDPAYAAFQAALKATPPMEFRLKPGDVLIVDNYRMLHGRRAIGAEGDRYLERHWIA